jgi:ABC-2 type transport system permease protein
MSPWIKIARRELRSLFRDRSLPVLAAAVAVLVALSVYAPRPAFRAAEEWKRASALAVRQQWVTQGSRHPHAAAHYGSYAFRPLSAIALLESGVSEYIGQTQPLETHSRHFAIHPPIEDSTSARRMAGLSSSSLALALFPLLLIVFGYGALAGERETGTLAQLLATGVSPGQILRGKAAGLLILCAPLLPAKVLLEAPAIYWLGMASQDWLRFAGLLAVQGTYACVWVFLILTVSARSRTSNAALAVLLSAWIASTFLAPRLAGSMGRLVVREPSVEEFRAAIQHDISTRPDGTPWVQTWSKQLIADTLNRYGVSRIEDLPVGYAGLMLKSSDAHYEEVFNKHFQRLFALHQQQERWHMALSWMSPMIAARSASQGLAGTDLAHAADFSNAAERYRRMFVEATNTAIEKGTKGTGWDLRVSRQYWESIPAFSYATPGPWWALGQQALSCGILLLWLVCSCICLFLSQSRLMELPR